MSTATDPSAPFVSIVMPCYNEVAHIPLFFWHPSLADRAGTRCATLTQTTDIAATLLDLHGAPLPAENQGHSLLATLAGSAPSREAVIYGVFGSAVNITDGRYTYFRYPPDMRKQELYEYTLMPTHLRSFFSAATLRQAQLVPPFGFTQEIPLLKIPARRLADGQVAAMGTYEDCTTVLFDLQADPGQLQPIADVEVEQRLLRTLVDKLVQLDAPAEAFGRIGLQRPR